MMSPTLLPRPKRLKTIHGTRDFGRCRIFGIDRTRSWSEIANLEIAFTAARRPDPFGGTRAARESRVQAVGRPLLRAAAFNGLGTGRWGADGPIWGERAGMLSERPKPAKPVPFGASHGPLADLESHLPEDWWRDMFNALYLLTDGDVAENDRNTKHEVDKLIAATGIAADSQVLDLCCGQGRHVLELARRGFSKVCGLDRSRYLIRLARRRARAAGLDAQFKEGDARHLRLPERSQDLVAIMGNSFGYFANREDDALMLAGVARVLKAGGQIALDLADGAWMKANYERRSWEWLDKHHFVCRERDLSADAERLVCREVVVHDERGVIADQFYAERLYTPESIGRLLHRAGFRNIRHHSTIETTSDRNQDLGMMARRMLVTACAPEKRPIKVRRRTRPIDVTVLLGDPGLPDRIKRDGRFNAEDFETVSRLKAALATINGYRFRCLDDHAALWSELEAQPPELVFNLCDEGLDNDPFKELHVPAFLEAKGYRYTGSGPSCLGLCYDKALVRAVAAGLDIPVPMETYVRPGDWSATLPSTFPAILKPNFGDSSFGITEDSVVGSSAELVERLEGLRDLIGDQPVLVQEFLTGPEYTVGLIGNPATGLHALPVMTVNYAGLPDGLPHLLGYESKWQPDSPYWSRIAYEEAVLRPDDLRGLVDHASRLFERLGCRDYARFDFRTDGSGEIKLLEANPNPSWCWDGKMALMADIAGWSYAEFLTHVLDAAVQRLELHAPDAAKRPAPAA